MPTLREVRQRITGVKKTQKITKAMKMVATAKLRRAQMNIVSARPYARGLAMLLDHLLGHLVGVEEGAEVVLVLGVVLQHVVGQQRRAGAGRQEDLLVLGDEDLDDLLNLFGIGARKQAGAHARNREDQFLGPSRRRTVVLRARSAAARRGTG